MIAIPVKRAYHGGNIRLEKACSYNGETDAWKKELFGIYG